MTAWKNFQSSKMIRPYKKIQAKILRKKVQRNLKIFKNKVTLFYRKDQKTLNKEKIIQKNNELIALSIRIFMKIRSQLYKKKI